MAQVSQEERLQPVGADWKRTAGIRSIVSRVIHPAMGDGRRRRRMKDVEESTEAAEVAAATT